MSYPDFFNDMNVIRGEQDLCAFISNYTSCTRIMRADSNLCTLKAEYEL